MEEQWTIQTRWYQTGRTRLRRSLEVHVGDIWLGNGILCCPWTAAGWIDGDGTKRDHIKCSEKLYHEWDGYHSNYTIIQSNFTAQPFTAYSLCHSNVTIFWRIWSKYRNIAIIYTTTINLIRSQFLVLVYIMAMIHQRNC